MFVDASIIVAIINQEDDWQLQLDRMERAEMVYVSPLVRFEAMLAIARAIAGRTRTRVTAKTLTDANDLLTRFLEEVDARQMTITPEIGSAAIEASMKYGKAVGHPADLNFGDCFVYACAKALKAELLYKGNDFAKTDLA